MRNLIILFFVFFGNLACASDTLKSHDENEPQYEIRHFTTDGAWTWFNDERVIIDNQILYIGSIDSQCQSRVNLFSLKNSSENLLEQEYNSRDIKEYR